MLHFATHHYRWDSVRSHPKFDELVRRVGMPVELAE
jgi:hypothetical protein